MLKVNVILCVILSSYLGNCQFEDFKTLAEIITECGENVRRVIVEPEYDSRPYVIRELAKYYHLLDHIEDKFRYKDLDAMEILEAVYNEGGPPHLNIEIDYDALQKQYKFKEGGMRDIKTIMSDTKELWEKLVKLLPEDKRQFHRRGQNIYQEDKYETSKGQVEGEDEEGSGQIDLIDEADDKSRGQINLNTKHDDEDNDESRGQIDLITNQNNEEEEGKPVSNNNNNNSNDDVNEQGKQNDWFNEEK